MLLQAHVPLQASQREIRQAAQLLLEKGMQSTVGSPVVMKVPKADARVSASSEQVQPIRCWHHSCHSAFMSLTVLCRPVLANNALLLLTPVYITLFYWCCQWQGSRAIQRLAFSIGLLGTPTEHFKQERADRYASLQGMPACVSCWSKTCMQPDVRMSHILTCMSTVLLEGNTECAIAHS